MKSTSLRASAVKRLVTWLPVLLVGAQASADSGACRDLLSPDHAIGSAARDAVRVLRDGATVYVPYAAGASDEGLVAILKRARVFEHGINVVMKSTGPDDSNYRLASRFAGPKANLRYVDSNVDGNFSTILVRVAPADSQGHYSLGPNSDRIRSVLSAHPNATVIAEVNANVPRTTGSNYLVASQITSQFTSHAALATAKPDRRTSVEELIGEQLASVIENDATIQLGRGNLFGALPAALKAKGRHGLKIDTELFQDSLMEMITSGVAVHAHAAYAYGTSELYAWLNENRQVEFGDTSSGRNELRAAETTRFTAINSALRVDLSGRCQSLRADLDGHNAFSTGASRAQAGRSIAVIRSTAQGGLSSSIVIDLPKESNTEITTPLTHVVTEYGVAELRGKSREERVLSLIRIAHPSFRYELAQQAMLEGQLSSKQLSEFLPLRGIPKPLQIEPLSATTYNGVVDGVRKQFAYDAEVINADQFEPTLERWREITKDPKSPHIYLVAKDTATGKVVGGAGVYAVADKGEMKYWGDWLFVNPSYRGLKIAEALYAARTAELKRRGIKHSYLYSSTLPEEAAAQALQAATGFYEFHREPYIVDGKRLQNADGSPAWLIYKRMDIK